MRTGTAELYRAVELLPEVLDSLVVDLEYRGRESYLPNDIFQVSAIPRTLSGKKMELPVKKLLMGSPAGQVFKLDAMANADCVQWFVEFARRRSG
jgi:acetoacetyl-CoA synthetase